MDPLMAGQSVEHTAMAGTIVAPSSVFRGPSAFVINALSMAFLFVVNAFKFFNWTSGKTSSGRPDGDGCVATDSAPATSQSSAVDADNRQKVIRPSVGPLTENVRCCFRCCSIFNVFFNRRLVCSQCGFFVCKDCAVGWNDRSTWICKFCFGQVNPMSPSYDWLQKKLQDRCRSNGAGKYLINATTDDLYDRRADNYETDSGYIPALSSATSLDSNLQHHQKCFRDVIAGGGGLDGFTSTSDPMELELREAVEAIVEQLIGSLDDVTLEPLCRHSEYERMVEIYHRKLRDAVAQLMQSLRTAMRCEITAEGVTEDCLSPTASHTALKQIIGDVIEEAECLPPMVEPDAGFLMTSSSLAKDPSRMAGGGLEVVDYEDMLATAILNRIIDRYQKLLEQNRSTQMQIDQEYDGRSAFVRVRSSRRENSLVSSSGRVISYSSKEIQTDIRTEFDDGHSESDRPAPITRWIEDGEVDFSWASRVHDNRRPPLQYTVEEQVEKVTVETTVEDDSECHEAVNEPVISRSVMTRDIFLPDLDNFGAGFEFVLSRKPEPYSEFGNEIEDLDESVAANWQQNWLFGTKRSVSPFCNMDSSVIIGEEPIAMFVPNPQEIVRARIGSTDVDELSDMSDGKDDINDDLISSHSDGNESDRSIGNTEFESTGANTIAKISTKAKIDLEDSLENALDKLFTAKSDGQRSSRAHRRPVPTPRRSRSPQPQESDGTACKVPNAWHDESMSITDKFSGQVNASASSASLPKITSDERSETVSTSSIVERERSKWLNPVQIRVNPYSSESIANRTTKLRIERDWSCSTKPSAVDKDLLQVDAEASHVKIDCGPKMTHLSRYRRDYYVPTAAPRRCDNGNALASSDRLRATCAVSKSATTGLDDPTETLPDVDGVVRSTSVNNLAAFWNRRVLETSANDNHQ